MRHLYSTLVFGLKCPHAAALMCGSFVVGRFMYTIGYKSGNPARVRNLALQLVLLLTKHLANTWRFHRNLVNDW